MDSIAFPGTEEALSVPLFVDKSEKFDYGWVGAAQSFSQLQGAIQNFASNEPTANGLGQYFGGLGWSSFYVPFPSMQIKLPSTKNFFNLSALTATFSIFRTGDTNTIQHQALAYAGDWYQADTGNAAGNGTFAKGDTVIQNVATDVIGTLAEGMVTNNPTFFPQGTKIKSLGANSITLTSAALQASQPSAAITFVGSQFTGSGSLSGNAITLDSPALLKSLQPRMLVQIPGKNTPIARVDHVDFATQKGILDGTPTVQGPFTFTFSGAIIDYIEQTLMKLWYAWADYYVGYVNRLAPFGPGQTSRQIPSGTIAAGGTNALTFPAGTDLSSLLPGMTVTGPGLQTDGTTTFISSIKGTTVSLSQFAAGPATNQPFTFTLPDIIPRSSYVPQPEDNPLQLGFAPAAQAKANQFATVAYSVMKEFSMIPQVQTTVAGTSIGQSVTNSTIVVGSTVGFDPS